MHQCDECGGLYHHLPDCSEKVGRLRFTMQDAEDFVYFWMNAPFGQGFSREVMLLWIAKINNLTHDDPRILVDFEAWIARTKAETEQKEKT